jgi:cysteine desulfurase/selenocysteine lyase
VAAVEWEAVRKEFPSLTGRVYLNTASFGQLPRRVLEAVLGHFIHRERTAAIDFLDWFEDLQPLRKSIARLIDAEAEDIAFVQNASSGLALAVSSVDWQHNDEILTLHGEFPNQIYAAHSTAGVLGVECEWHELETALTERTRLVIMSTVNYSTGLRADLEETVAGLKKRGVVICLDGTQSIGALRFSCAAIQPDFLIVDAYKWLNSPNGAGFVFVHPKLRERLRPNVIGWRSDQHWRNVNDLHHGAPRFGSTAEKYEAGMLPFACLYGMKASLELVEELGMEAIEGRVLELAGFIRADLAALGAEFSDCKGKCLPSQIVTARLPGVDAAVLAQRLAEQGISVSARKGSLRVSPHFYNNESDVENLISRIVDIGKLS